MFTVLVFDMQQVAQEQAWMRADGPEPVAHFHNFCEIELFHTDLITVCFAMIFTPTTVSIANFDSLSDALMSLFYF